MPTETITSKDATVVVHAAYTGGIKIDVTCRQAKWTGLTPQQFGDLVYPAIDMAALHQSEGQQDDPQT